MSEFAIPPCPENWDECHFCGAPPGGECRNPDYQKKGKLVASTTSIVTYHPTSTAMCMDCTTPSLCAEAGCGVTGKKERRVTVPKDAPKETNPKDAVAVAKVSTSLVPEIAIIELAQAFRDGAKKYTPFNWRRAPVKMSVYLDAMERHLLLLRSGQDIASDSGLAHVTHIMSGCAILLDAKLNDTVIDDRHKLEWKPGCYHPIEAVLDDYHRKNQNPE